MNIEHILRNDFAEKRFKASQSRASMPNAAELTKHDALDLFRECHTTVGFSKTFWPVVEPGREYVPGWHLDCVGEHLDVVSNPRSAEIPNLIINVPPRCMKSLMVCVFWFCRVWTFYPASRWMFSSFSEDLIVRDSKRCRDIIKHPLYQRLWDVRIRSDSDTALKFSNHQQGVRQCVTTRGAGGMGEGADFLVIDDPQNPRLARSAVERQNTINWYRSTFSRRGNDERTVRKLLIMQRLDEADLTGYMLAEQLGWQHLVLPMRYEPVRYWFGDGTDGGDASTASGEPVAALSPDKGTFDLNSALEQLGTNKSETRRPRDAIQFTALQKRNPKLRDAPEGSGRAEAGDLLWPERFPEWVVEKAEAELGPDAAGQYQQRPTGEAGDIFQKESFRYYEAIWDHVENPSSGLMESRLAWIKLHGPNAGQERLFPAGEFTFFQTIDTALTEKRRSAYTACLTFGVSPEYDIILWNVFRAKLAVPDQYPTLNKLRKGPGKWHPKLRQFLAENPWPFTVALRAIEAKASGIGIIQQAGAEGDAFHPLKTDGDKTMRAAPVASYYLAGKVYHPIGRPKWCAEAEDELLVFPNGTYKDVADCIAYAGILTIRDKIVRAMCGNRVMADAEPETAQDVPDSVTKVKIGGYEMEIDWGNDGDDEFGSLGNFRR